MFEFQFCALQWLKKQKEARKMAELTDADLSELEKNPSYLRDKAESFVQCGDYQSAIGVYNHAIRLNPNQPG